MCAPAPRREQAGPGGHRQVVLLVAVGQVEQYFRVAEHGSSKPVIRYVFILRW
jgi:hypothetical protein